MLVIDKLSKAVGTLVSWLTVILVLIMVVDVAMRYLFSVTSAVSFELGWHLFAATAYGFVELVNCRRELRFYTI
jgi:TRAP-type mannitol/chloroaromatic compound transport system permease small subunit